MQFKISNYIPRLNVKCLDLSLNSKRRGKKSVRKTKRKSLNVFFSKRTSLSNNYTDIAVSPVFPRKIFCDMAIRQLSTLQSYTIVCVLPVNECNEQVCFLEVILGGGKR
jgi:hypothetical protein